MRQSRPPAYLTPVQRRSRRSSRRGGIRSPLLPVIVLALAAALVAALIGWAVYDRVTGAPSADSASPDVSAEDGASATDDPAEDPVARAASVKANEMGRIPIFLYHVISEGEGQYNRTPEGLRQDIATLKAAGYYPINARDLAEGNIDVPAGKSPVVITFDDSSIGQYRIDESGAIDPDSAIAILQQTVAEGDWASRATFFPLIEVDVPDREVFGQPELAAQKLQQLVAWGYEVGSHTVTHLDLREAYESEARKQLFVSKTTLEELIGGGYRLTSLAPPFGSMPDDISSLVGGEYEGQPYQYEAAFKAVGGAAPSPFSTEFNVLGIPRIMVTGSMLTDTLATFEQSPGLRYVSDGDPSTIAIPIALDESLGSVDPETGLEIVRY
jgi:peptidoglycan/xylan/chitin deacetylase (PgdA/CDA1 family)